MDWGKLKPVAGKLAQAGLPTLGQVVGDLIPFPGGSIIGEMAGQWAGKAIAEALGVPESPEAVGAAIDGLSPTELQARLQGVESEAAAKFGALAEIVKAQTASDTAQSQAINETQRAEIAAGVSWWHWRHLIGYVLVLLGFELCILLPLVLFGRINAADLGAILTALSPVLAIFAGLNGWVASDTTKKAIAAITGEAPPSVASTVVKAVLPARKK